MNEKTNSVIQVKYLTKRYRNLNDVDHVSFEVERGGIFSLLGPNGAGKTTTMSMLTTVASFSQGEAKVAGYELGTDPGPVRRRIGVLPQEVTLDDELKRMEHLLFAARLHHVPENVARTQAKELLSLAELEDAADLRVKTYSGH